MGRRLAAEAVGTAFLLAVVVGSGIMGERLAGGNVAIALLANSLATGCGLAVLIFVLAPISGAHFNPAVTLVAALERELPWGEVLPYVTTQIGSAFLGVVIAHLMFAEPSLSASTKLRSGPPQWLSEWVATFGLLMVVIGCTRQKAAWTPLAVAAYITAAYWFTASTSFANPAVTLARGATNTFAGIRPDNVAAFVASQVVGALCAWAFMTYLVPRVGPRKEQ